jgi:hypothetical protein
MGAVRYLLLKQLEGIKLTKGKPSINITIKTLVIKKQSVMNIIISIPPFPIACVVWQSQRWVDG